MAERYRDALVVVRSKVAQRVAQAWDRLGSWDRPDVERFTAVVVPTVEAGQRRAQALTDIYLSRLVGIGPVGLTESVGASTRNGTEPAAVYERPFVQLWAALGAGVDFERARAAAGARAAGSAQTDVSLSMRAAAVEWSDQAEFERRVIGWERVMDDGACAFCAAASTQRYKSADLLPLHDRCNCSVAPVFPETDLAIRRFNGQLLDRLKAEAQNGGRTDYWNSKHFKVSQDGELQLPQVATHEHGELGRVVTEAAHDFTGPSGIPDAA